jgi:hypothetical protein
MVNSPMLALRLPVYRLGKFDQAHDGRRQKTCGVFCVSWVCEEARVGRG